MQKRMNESKREDTKKVIQRERERESKRERKEVVTRSVKRINCFNSFFMVSLSV